MPKNHPPLPTTPTLAYALDHTLYLNLTHRCTLRCAFCPKFTGRWTVHDYDLRLRQEPTAAEVLDAIPQPVGHYPEIVFCGLGEPTLRLEVLLDVATQLRTQGVRGLRLNTDGLANLVHGRNVVPDLAAVLDRVSISLTAHNETLYNHHTRPKRPGAYAAMLDFAAQAQQQGLAVTLTAIDGLEGVDIPACKAIAEQLGVGFRSRTLDVVGSERLAMMGS